MNAILSCSCLAWSPAPGAREGRFALKPRGKRKDAKSVETPVRTARRELEVAYH